MALLAHAHLQLTLPTIAAVATLLNAVPAAREHIELQRARTAVDDLHRTTRQQATRPDSCPELGALAQAIGNRDLDAYHQALLSIENARAERAAEHRRMALAQTLQAAHPRLLELLRSSTAGPCWDTRLANLPAAWAWSKAEQFVRKQRNADEERRLTKEFDEVEDRINRVTEQLAAAEAMRACLDRMTDTHARALRSYGQYMNYIGAGSGRKTREFRRGARAAMEKAKTAVPAWVVPLPNLLENIIPDRDSFDVVIVDEASQVGLEHLFLLWMAPRVIVVGDDKQCTPGVNRMGTNLEDLFRSLREHLGELDTDIGLHFTPKSNLYGLLSARSGKDAVVRLREHFRCMPEIIGWSSSQFYGGATSGLVPLRERTSQDLEPLQVVHIADAYPEGSAQAIRNPVEAKRIVAQLVECLADPRYTDKTFGIVVLQGHGQIKLLEHEINASVSPEDRVARKIRVGSPPNFQGDERDVMFLTTVVTKAPRTIAAPSYQQSYNVAASRAKDQMWLFTSVAPSEYKPGDLRGSLAGYMLDPPSIYGHSPELTAVSPTQPCPPFESLFEQRVYRAIKQRGYHVVPQVRVGSRTLDLVVVGDGGRLAVECDGHYWHTSPTEVASDARRDRELRRMGWDVIRIRESEFEFDPGREMSTLWRRLDERNIHPKPSHGETGSQWVPADLPSDDDEGAEP